MRRKYMVKLRWAPANCNHQGTEAWLGARVGHRQESAQVASSDERGFSNRCEDYGWDHHASCLRRVAIARRHRARQLLLLARELCASAALYRVQGSGSTATRTLRLAYTALRDRAEIAKAERGRD